MTKDNKQTQDTKNKQKTKSSNTPAKQDMTHKAKSLALITTITAVLLFATLGLLSVLDSNDVVDINNQAPNDSSEEVSGNIEALDNFPDAVPVYQPSELTRQEVPGSNEDSDDFDDSWSRHYTTDAGTDTLISFYEEELSQNGWVITDSFESNEEVYSKSIIARHEEQKLDLTAWVSEHSELDHSRIELSAIRVE